MARADHFTGVQMHCIVCSKTIPPERRRDAVTCSKECSKARDKYIQSRMDNEECRYCRRPSTPEERARFKQWQKWDAEGAKIEDSVPALQKKIQSLQRKVVEQALVIEKNHSGKPFQNGEKHAGNHA